MALPLRVTVTPEKAEASPGDSVTLDVSVRNTADVVEHYLVELVGLPPGAVSRTEPAVTKLRPGETGTATVGLTVPMDAPAPAGVYIIGVLVRSRYRDDVSRCEELPLTLHTVQNVAVSVEPEIATGGRTARYEIEVTNDGNVPVRLQLAGTDPERRVTATFDPPALDLAPRTAARVALGVRAPMPWGKEKRSVLTIEAAAITSKGGAGTGGRSTATFVQRPRLASRLSKVAGMLGAVTILAAAVVGAAVIAKDDPAPPAAGQPVASTAPLTAGTTTNPSAGPPTESRAAATTAPTTAPTASAASHSAGGPPTPRKVDLTDLPGVPVGGLVPSDAFAAQGLILAGLPDPDGPPECLDATAIILRDDGVGGRFLTAGLPSGLPNCAFVPVQIRFTTPVAAARVTLGGNGKRRLEAAYKDLSRTNENDLEAGDDGRRGFIDYILVRGLPGPDGERPAAAIRSIEFTPAPA